MFVAAYYLLLILFMTAEKTLDKNFRFRAHTSNIPARPFALYTANQGLTHSITYPLNTARYGQKKANQKIRTFRFYR